MVIKELHLGITRNCTLYCEHCLRGEKECINMNLDTLDNLFKDVNGVDVILITGGEPLIAIQQLEKLAQIIKDKGIVVEEIRMITNGTIMSARVLRVLKELSKLAKLNIKVSANIFHRLELERLGFVDLRNKNFEILERFFGAIWYGKELEESKENYMQLLDYKGRTKTLTKERLAEINNMVAEKYVTSDELGIPVKTGKSVAIFGDTIWGQLTIDAYGNIVGYGLEYVEEDQEALETGININSMSLRDAVEGYIDIQDRKSKEKKIKILRK